MGHGAMGARPCVSSALLLTCQAVPCCASRAGHEIGPEGANGRDQQPELTRVGSYNRHGASQASRTAGRAACRIHTRFQRGVQAPGAARGCRGALLQTTKHPAGHPSCRPTPITPLTSPLLPAEQGELRVLRHRALSDERGVLGAHGAAPAGAAGPAGPRGGGGLGAGLPARVRRLWRQRAARPAPAVHAERAADPGAV